MTELVGWDALRFLNAALAAAGLIGMVIRWRWWRGQGQEIRLLLCALAGLVAAVGWANLDVALRGGQPGGMRLFFFVPPLLWILIAQVRARPTPAVRTRGA